MKLEDVDFEKLIAAIIKNGMYTDQDIKDHLHFDKETTKWHYVDYDFVKEVEAVLDNLGYKNANDLLNNMIDDVAVKEVLSKLISDLRHEEKYGGIFHKIEYAP